MRLNSSRGQRTWKGISQDKDNWKEDNTTVNKHAINISTKNYV